MDLNTIKLHVSLFIYFAQNHPHMTFQVTQVGCGLSGWKPSDIAPMFHDAAKEGSNCLFDQKWQDYLPETTRFWGTG